MTDHGISPGSAISLIARADKYLNTGSGEYASDIMRDMAEFIRASLQPASHTGCVCQDQHRRGYCTEPGCPYSDPEIMKARDAAATPSNELNQHIAWLKQYVEGMTAANWQDMRLRAERQLEQISKDLDTRGVAQARRQWPRVFNVQRCAENGWHGEISFARCPTDEELKALEILLRDDHQPAPTITSTTRECGLCGGPLPCLTHSQGLTVPSPDGKAKP